MKNIDVRKITLDKPFLHVYYINKGSKLQPIRRGGVLPESKCFPTPTINLLTAFKYILAFFIRPSSRLGVN